MNEENYVNFDEIVDKIDDVLSRTGYLITTEVEMNIVNHLNEIKTKIDEELNKLYVNIDKVPDFSNCMVDTYEKLYKGSDGNTSYSLDSENGDFIESNFAV